MAHNTDIYSPIPAELVPQNFDGIGMSADALFDYIRNQFQEDINKNVPIDIKYEDLDGVDGDFLGIHKITDGYSDNGINIVKGSIIITTDDSVDKYQICLSKNNIFVRTGVISITPIEENTTPNEEQTEVQAEEQTENTEEENNDNENNEETPVDDSEDDNEETPVEPQVIKTVTWGEWRDLIKENSPFTNPEIAYLKSLFAAEKQQEFENKFSVVTAGGSSTNYWADQEVTPNPTSEVAVTVKFDNVNIDTAVCSDTVKSKDGDSAYWDDSVTGVYKHTIDKTASSKVSSFTYSPSEGDYAGLTVTKQASAKYVIVTPKYPSWYIIVNANKTIADNFAEVIALLNNTHRQENLLNSYIIDNRGGSNGVRLWIITKSNISSIKDEMSLDFKDSQGSNKSFVSPSNNSITLDGYNVYVTKTVGTDSSTGYVKVNIS